MVLTQIGEIGISFDSREYLLRPSLYAMTQIGEPAEIVRVYASVMSERPHAEQFSDALAVIYACAEDEMPALFGGIVADGQALRYEPGEAPAEHVLPLARCLMKHGITGALPELPRKAGQEQEFVGEFDARAHVSLAIAHLGMSSAEAWRMTMTELVGALRAKFPPVNGGGPGALAPSSEEHEAAMDWFERVEAARSKAQGGH